VNATERVIYTIGHSNLTLADFVARLHGAGIDTVVDVRSQPVSRHSPHFERRSLADALRGAGIRYAFMGDSLGGRPENTKYYDAEGYVRYDLWAASPRFQDGLAKIMRAAAERRIALLCSEGDPARCHRHLLIARALAEQGWPRARIVHIDAKGGYLPDDAIPTQAGLFGGDAPWRSPQSVLHKVRPSTSSSA
jgi:uncharacterized protein (DUF488 family)